MDQSIRFFEAWASARLGPTTEGGDDEGMKISSVDVESAFARGFQLAFMAALISSLVSQIYQTGVLQTSVLELGTWATLRNVVMGSITLALLISLLVGVLVFCWRVVKIEASNVAPLKEPRKNGSSTARVSDLLPFLRTHR